MDNLNASLVASREQSESKEDMVEEVTGGFDKNASLDQADEKNKSSDEQGLSHLFIT